MSAVNKSVNRTALIILSRFPEEGRVKERLAQTIGAPTATQFYRLCTERLFKESERIPQPLRRYLFYTGVENDGPFREWAGGAFRFEAQQGANPGERIQHAFRLVFAQRARKAVIVGNDVPDLTADLMYEAIHLLDSYDLVIGPNHNGGYYLLGMKMLHSDLFQNIPWGTSRVYGQTLRVIKAMGLSVAFLPVLMDVDSEDDLKRWIGGQRRQIEGNLEDYLRDILS